jgi:hypothetical protein
LALLTVASLPAAQPWRGITMPTVAEAAASFSQPPLEYGAIHWAIWGGPQSKERIIADIERIHANGGGVYMINNSQRVQPKYLSPEYMDLVKTVVAECKKRGMKVWIETDCGYPDGFAGGMISRDYPQLGMQGIIADAHCTVAAGETLDIPLPVDTLGILAYPRPETAAPAADAPAPTNKPMPLPADGNFKYAVPRGGAGELTVQLPNADVRYNVAVGEPFSIPVPPGTKGIFLAASAGGGRGRGGRGGGGAPEGTVVPLPADGHLKWAAPAGTGSWELAFIRHAYRTSPTRNDNGEDGGATKDTLYTLIDYLDPVATRTFIKIIYETYEKAVGDEFGKTILGFRGDETDYSGVTPWTPKLLETFQAVKGYDFKPYIPLIFGGHMTPEAQRAKADYWDVWSAMFRDNFYKLQQEWCNARNMEYMVHLNHEETMVSLVNSEGSFWRDMRYVGVTGIDNLSQIGPGIVADFPKLAASAAHLYGRSLVWEEEGGSIGQNGKFVFDYQLVRGVNHMNIRGLTAAAPAEGALNPAADIGWYVSRSQYLMANGRPAAQIAFLHPTDSLWMGDREADGVTLKLVTQLLEHQIDFDHIDADTLATVCTLEGGGLKNLSGQVYRAVIVPTSTVIQKEVLARLRAFAKNGGKVIFVGRTPTLVIGKTFLNPEAGAPDLSFAVLEPEPEITAKVVAALPPPDVKLDAACPPIKYIHRTLKDGEVYFFFNESNQAQSRTATLAGNGQVQVWDATTGIIHPLTGVPKAAGTAAVPLSLAPQEGRLIVIGALPAGVGAPLPAFSGNPSIADLDDGWSLTLGDKQVTTSLKTWEEMGVTGFNGTGIYKREFTPAFVPQDKRFYLDLGNVHEIARVRLNGTDLPMRPWPPYLWDVTASIKEGVNTLEVQVQTVPAQSRGSFGGGAPGAAGGRRGGPGAPGPEAGAARGPAPTGVPPGAANRGGLYSAPPPVAASGLLGPVRVLAQ